MRQKHSRFSATMVALICRSLPPRTGSGYRDLMQEPGWGDCPSSGSVKVKTKYLKQKYLGHRKRLLAASCD